LFVAGLNVDVSPRNGLLFPLTKFVPWAACARLRDATRFLLEQDALFEVLDNQSAENPDQISFDGTSGDIALLTMKPRLAKLLRVGAMLIMDIRPEGQLVVGPSVA
jgi:hypothetical protein